MNGASFVIPIKAVPWKAPLKGARGFYSPLYEINKIYEAEIRKVYKGDLLKGDLSLRAEFFFEPPASWPDYKKFCALKGLLNPDSDGDLTNLAKQLEDRMQTIVFENDRCIKRSLLSVQFGIPARIEVGLFIIREGLEKEHLKTYYKYALFRKGKLWVENYLKTGNL